jgi:hypothetical protein
VLRDENSLILGDRQQTSAAGLRGELDRAAEVIHGWRLYFNAYESLGTGSDEVSRCSFITAGHLSADDWDSQMMFFLEHGFRVIAHDRRGHGRSTQTFLGHDMDTYAADVAELVEALDLKNSIHIGHSTGGGEVTRYVSTSRSGSRRKSCSDQRHSSHVHAVSQEPRRSPERGGGPDTRGNGVPPLAVL